MPDAKVSTGSPYYVGAAPPPRDHLVAATKWNPLEGIGRHWSEGQQESAFAPRAFASSAGSTVPPSLLKPTSLTEELNSAESRVHALRAKISRLEADLVHGHGASSADGHLRIVVPH